MSEAVNLKLWYACDNDKISEVRSALQDGADPNWKHPGSGGVTSLMMAAKHKHSDIVRMILSTPGVNTNIVSSAGQTCLHFLCRWSGNIESGRLILNHSSDINLELKSKDNHTALHWARVYGRNDIVKIIEDKMKEPRFDDLKIECQSEENKIKRQREETDKKIRDGNIAVLGKELLELQGRRETKEQELQEFKKDCDKGLLKVQKEHSDNKASREKSNTEKLSNFRKEFEERERSMKKEFKERERSMKKEFEETEQKFENKSEANEMKFKKDQRDKISIHEKRIKDICEDIARTQQRGEEVAAYVALFQPTAPPPQVTRVTAPDCTICLNRMSPPMRIFSCVMGHHTCANCRDKMAICWCREKFAGRAIDFENFLQDLQ